MTSNKNITELKDNSVRHKLILRYLEVETSLEEEHLLTDYYSQARENELTKEDLTIRTILLGTSAKEEIALSGSAATEFDRIIADSQTQRMCRHANRAHILHFANKRAKESRFYLPTFLKDCLPKYRDWLDRPRDMGKRRLHISCQ